MIETIVTKASAAGNNVPERLRSPNSSAKKADSIKNSPTGVKIKTEVKESPRAAQRIENELTKEKEAEKDNLLNFHSYASSVVAKLLKDRPENFIKSPAVVHHHFPNIFGKFEDRTGIANLNEVEYQKISPLMTPKDMKVPLATQNMQGPTPPPKPSFAVPRPPPSVSPQLTTFIPNRPTLLSSTTKIL